MPQDGTHDADQGAGQGAKGAVKPRGELRITFADTKGVSPGDPKLLLRWLKQDPDLPKAIAEANPRKAVEQDDLPLLSTVQPSGPHHRMGILEDIVVSLVVATAEIAVFTLVRSIYSHVRNRRGVPLEVTVTVPGTEVTITLKSGQEHTKEELRSWGGKAARAITERGAQ